MKLHAFELTLSTGKAIPTNGKSKVTYAPELATRIDGYATRGAADVYEVRIRRSRTSKERSGRIDHAQIPWPIIAPGDALEVTLRNNKKFPVPVGILLRGVVVT